MRTYYPDYYTNFQCIAGKCPDSCCKDWAVQIDDAAAAYYRSLPGALGDALRQALCQEDGDTILTLTKDGRCPMWLPDGLCRIQKELGEQALCSVCTQFPRLRHDYGSFVELGLELSCPEAARLILSSESPAWICRDTTEKASQELDPECMEILLRSRQSLLNFIDDHNYPVEKILAASLLYGYSVQQELDGGEEAVFNPTVTESFPETGDYRGIGVFFSKLEILTPKWKLLLSQLHPPRWDPRIRNLFRYFIQRYYLQAVSDLDLVCRVKFAIASCILIGCLPGEITEAAQLYSKEIENDLDNVEAILDGAYTCPALTDRNLLSLLR